MIAPDTRTDAQLLRAAAEKLRQGVAHCVPEAHDYHAPDGAVRPRARLRRGGQQR